MTEDQSAIDDKNPGVDLVIACPDRIWPVSGGGSARIFALMAHLRSEGFRVGLATSSHGGALNSQMVSLADVVWFYKSAANSARNAVTVMPSGMQRAAAQFRVRARRALPESVRAGLIRPIRAALTGHPRGRPQTAPDSESPSFLATRIRPAFNKFVCACVQESGARAVIVVYPWTARALADMPDGVLKIVDTIDVQHLRRQKAQDAGHDLPDRACTREEEQAELAHAEVLIAIQAGEAEVFREMLPTRRVIVAEHAVGAMQWHRSSPEALDLLYVGNLYPPNVEGAHTFLDVAWPAIRAQVPQARLIVCGKVSEALRDRTDPGLVLEGLVPSLDPYYSRAAIVLNLVPYGTGLKIKTVEALAHGKCAVVTPAGAEGLRASPVGGLTIAEIADMPRAIVPLLLDPASRAREEEAAWAYAQQHLAPAAVYRELTTLLRDHLDR